MTHFRLSAPQLHSLHPSRAAAPSPRPHIHPFADANYFQRVIGLLHSARRRKGVSLQQLAALSGLRKNVIIRAEKEGIVPTCGEFKAWTQALGISWDQLWSMGFPLEGRNEAS